MSKEKTVVDDYGDYYAITELDSREIVGGSVSNVVSHSSETSGTEVARFTTLPHNIFSSDKSESHSGHLKLGRSKTEPPTHSSQFAEEAANISDDSDSEQQKLKLLKRIATVKDNGTVEFEIPGDEESRVLGVESQSVSNEVEDEPLDEIELHYIPPMQIVMLIVGTRGDVQPFIAIGKRLQEYGHRVRLATHANFKEFVLTAGLEFYPLGGDPVVLAGYMVKNKGFLPSAPSEIPVQRNQLKEIISSLLPACEEPDMDTGVPFKADAIIANPPAYGHTHVAAKALFVRPNVAALCIRRLSCSVQPRLPAMVKCYSIAVRSYRPMKQLSHIGLKFEAFAGHRSFSIRATSDTGSSSFDSPLMQSMEKKIKEQLDADTVVVKDAYGDGRHVSIDVIATAFEGQSAVNRQRMVYKAIWEELQNTVHAVDQMTTKTPTEAAAGK